MAYNYADTSAANAGGFSPSFEVAQAGWDLEKNLADSKFQRDEALRGYTQGNIDRQQQAQQAWRQLPQAFNQRGMIDSGQYQRGGQILADRINQIQGRASLDYASQIEQSKLMDALLNQQYEELKDMLTSQDYQSTVAGVVSSGGGMA